MLEPTWSEDGQTPAFLAATRLATLPASTISRVLHDLSLRPGMRVLDVGCGSGEYTFRLGGQTTGVTYVGVDFDANFVAFANDRARGVFGYPYEEVNSANTYEFIQADGLDLPFEDCSFDVVVSHTYLTALPDYMGALAEMCRVCKPGGWVSSVTLLGENFHGVGRLGFLPLLLSEDVAPLVNKVAHAQQSYDSHMALFSGIPPKKVPVAFAWIGLDGVAATPLGQYFCLSDARLDEKDYIRYVHLMHRVEVEAAQLLWRRADADQFSDEEKTRYLVILDERKSQLLATQGSNQEWDWYGSCALHVYGQVPKWGLHDVAKIIQEPQRRADLWRDRVFAAGLKIGESSKTCPYGRGCKVILTVWDQDSLEDQSSPRQIISAWGLQPAQARMLAYAQLLDAQQELGLSWCKVANPSSLNDKDAACVNLASVAPLLWETVAEAAQAGWVYTFFEDEVDGEFLVTAKISHVKTAAVGAYCAKAKDRGLAYQVSCAACLEYV